MSRDADNLSVNPFQPYACKFCYIGAAYVVANKLMGKPRYWGNLSLQCDNVLGRMVKGEDWDSATDTQRTEWATKLANYRENV